MAKFKDKRIRGFAGFLDRRSQPDSMTYENFRLVLNASVRGRNRRCRRGGFRKLLDGVNANYNNEDLHDQLLGLSFYYEEFEENIVIPGGVQGYVYQYWFPGINNPASIDKEFLGTFCGYWPDFLGVYDDPPFDGYAIDEPKVVGWPYAYNPADAPYSPCDVEDGGVYYDGSSFNLVYATYDPGEFVAPYGFGDYSPVYGNTKAYTNIYCGNYPYEHNACNERVTYLGSVGNVEGERTLIAATKSRIYALNTSMGNWKIVADGLGGPIRESEDCNDCSSIRFMGAVVDNVIVLTNGVDRVLAYNPLAQPTGCEVWRATEIQDLIDLDVLSAGVVGAWKSFCFLGDLFQDGARRRNRIAWSNFGDPYSWIPADDNLAGFQDLGIDETILRIEGMNDFLFIYTDKSIYRGALIQTGGTATFVFEEIYRGDALALKFKYAFANTGEAHYYWSKDRLNKMTSFEKRPVEPLVIRLASNAVFEGVSEQDLTFSPLNQSACDHFIGGYNDQFKEVWFSWPTGRSVCPDMSMVINTTTGEEGVDFVDEGFTAFHWWDGRDSVTLFEWLERIEACERQDLLSDLVKEGLPYTTESDPFDAPVLHIWNADEDPDQDPSDDSLCAAVQSDWLRDVCADCNILSRFVMANARDSTLKEYTDESYYREMLENGLYVFEGYDTVLQSGLDAFGTDGEKEINSLSVSFTAVPQTSPNILYGYVGYANTPGCPKWELLRFYDDDCDTLAYGVPLDCLTDKTDEQHEADGTRPDEDASWPTKIRGRNLAWKLKVEGTGGGVCFSRGTISIAELEY